MRTEQTYLVNDVSVTLVRDEKGARWECGKCKGECEHVLRAAAWLTLQSWNSAPRAELH